MPRSTMASRFVGLLHAASGPSLYIPRVSFPLGARRFTFDISWLALLPLAVWAVIALYVPAIAPSIQGPAAVSLGVAGALLLIASLLAHAFAHILVARLLRTSDTFAVPLFAFGDAAQAWPQARSPLRDAAVAAAGPAASLVLAVAFFLLWFQVRGAYPAALVVLLAGCNLVVALINLTPAYPFDGGRILRALGWGVTGIPRFGEVAAGVMTAVVPLALAGWAAYLFVQDRHVGGQTAVITVIATLLLALGLLHGPAAGTVLPITVRRRLLPMAAMAFPALAVCVGMLAAAGALLPMNHGIRMPGFAIAAEPFVDLPLEHRHPSNGVLLFTTVVTHTPTVAGLWAVAHIDRASMVLPPGGEARPGYKQQEQAVVMFELMRKSDLTAAVVALRQVGLEVEPQTVGVRIVEVSRQSLALGILREGDVVVAVNSEPANTVQVLNELLQRAPDGLPVTLEVMRDGESVMVDIQLLPAMDGLPARIGMMGTPVITGYTLPISIDVLPRKSVGGSSGGLVFMLAMYNLLTPGDITRGLRIAGTGTIDLDGNVGAIGGVQQKVVAAERAGASYFLVPQWNYEDAAAMARTVTVVPVATVDEALAFLRGLPVISPVILQTY